MTSRYGCGEQDIGLGEPGVIYLVGEEFAVLAKRDSVDLSTRIKLDGHQLGSIMCGKLEPCVKGYLTIRHFLCVQGSFGLGCGFNAIGKYDVNTILGVPMGDLSVM